MQGEGIGIALEPHGLRRAALGRPWTYWLFHMFWAILTFLRAVSSVNGGLRSAIVDGAWAGG